MAEQETPSFSTDHRPLVRRAQLQDSAAIASLMCELGYQTTSAQMENRLRSLMPNPAYTTLVAVSGGKVCGMIGTFARLSYEHDDLSGRILALVVSRKMRQSGIGRALINAAEADFGSRGIKRVAVNTRLTRKEAHEFYQHLGFERNGYRFVKRLA